MALVGEGFQEAPGRSGPSDARRDPCGPDPTGGCAVGPGFDGGGVDWSRCSGWSRKAGGKKTACHVPPKMFGAPALWTLCKTKSRMVLCRGTGTVPDRFRYSVSQIMGAL